MSTYFEGQIDDRLVTLMTKVRYMYLVLETLNTESQVSQQKWLTTYVIVRYVYLEALNTESQDIIPLVSQKSMTT